MTFVKVTLSVALGVVIAVLVLAWAWDASFAYRCQSAGGLVISTKGIPDAGIPARTTCTR